MVITDYGNRRPQQMNATWNNVSTHNTSYPETIGTYNLNENYMNNCH